MKKGARVTLTVFVRGEDKPAHNFLNLVIRAITWALGQIPKFSEHPGLTVEIEEIAEVTGSPDER